MMHSTIPRGAHRLITLNTVRESMLLWHCIGTALPHGSAAALSYQLQHPIHAPAQRKVFQQTPAIVVCQRTNRISGSIATDSAKNWSAQETDDI